MNDNHVPYERLLFFQKRLNLCDDDLKVLDPYREDFIARKHEFGRHFYEFFSEIPQTSIIIEKDRPPRRLENTLSHWFEVLFREGLSKRFVGYLWKSGFRHVESNLDQRYVNLGYAVARQFCQEMVRSRVPGEDLARVSEVIDKLLDFCVLVATDSFVTATARCDRQVINGIAHQVRNPIMVIGGNIRRLQKSVEEDSKTYRVYEAIIKENQRLERMVNDVGVYTELFQKDPLLGRISLEAQLEGALRKLRDKRGSDSITVEMDIEKGVSHVTGDSNYLETAFYYLLENSLEAASAREPYISIKVRPSPQPHFVEIQIFNNGDCPREEELDQLFTPFYSSKSMGTGFGLPIASLAIHKNLGTLSLEPVPGEGTRCVVTLPAAENSQSDA